MEAIVETFLNIEKGNSQDFSDNVTRSALKVNLRFEVFIKS